MVNGILICKILQCKYMHKLLAAWHKIGSLLVLMKDLLSNLLKLQAHHFEKTEVLSEDQINALRSQIPPQVIGHYDRLVARGKKGVSVVRNQVCTGCHMRLPIGAYNTLLQGIDIQLCESCGRYLYVPDAAETKVEDTIAAAKVTVKAPAKPRKRKAVANAA